MFPLRDTVPSRSVPIVNYLLIAANLFVFFLMLFPQPVPEAWIERLGVVPARLLKDPFSTETLTLFSSMFLHAGWFHLISNMWALFIFGDNVEDRLGSLRYLLFYVLGGLAGGVVHVLLNPSSAVPAVGASGAISAVMAAYLVSFPRARVITLVMLFIFPWLVELPAVLFIGFWFASQFLNGLLAVASGVEALGGVAYWAHIGGFVAGLILVFVLRPRPRVRGRFADERLPW
jgi:membrane associated rhomboid family serine protease